LEALCKQHTEATQKLREEKATLEGMVESHDELIMEIDDEIGLNRMGEDAGNEEEEDDSDKDDNGDGGDAVAPPAAAPPTFPVTPAAAREVIIVEEEDRMQMVHEEEAPEAHEVIFRSHLVNQVVIKNIRL
jgi:hypothetical protein